MDWQLLNRSTLLSTPPFDIEELKIGEKGRNTVLAHPYYRISSPSWVNVLALTPDREAIVVRQPRSGMMEMTLELPGGNMDRGEDPEAAALRELEEETGYRSQDIRHLATVSPNPAIMNNRLHMYLATGCRLPEQRRHFPDAMERIEVLLLPLPALEKLLMAGEFPSALSALTLLMALRYAEADKHR